MIVRIPVTDDNADFIRIYPEFNEDDNNTGNNTGNNEGYNDEINDLSGNVEFSLNPASLADYASSRFQFPVTTVNVAVPDDDKPVVASWLGNASSTSLIPSDTFVKRMTAAVISAYKAFVSSASRSGLFTSPFQIGYALRLNDGTFALVSQPKLLVPNVMAPLMAIREASPTGESLTTVTEIRNYATQLSVSIAPVELSESMMNRAESIQIFVNRQTSLLTGDESVASIRSYQIDGAPVPCWNYKRMEEDLVRMAALRDESFRVIATIPISEAMGGMDSMAIPAVGINLEDWGSLPLFNGTISGSDDPVVPGQSEPIGLRMVSRMLDLGMPEAGKRVRGVSLRGIFPRSGNGAGKVRLTLYGSHHRSDRRRLAAASGPHIRLLRGYRYRWYQVEAELPPQATVDALTFDIKT